MFTTYIVAWSYTSEHYPEVSVRNLLKNFINSILVLTEQCKPVISKLFGRRPLKKENKVLRRVTREKYPPTIVQLL